MISSIPKKILDNFVIGGIGTLGESDSSMERLPWLYVVVFAQLAEFVTVVYAAMARVHLVRCPDAPDPWRSR